MQNAGLSGVLHCCFYIFKEALWISVHFVEE